MDKHINCHCSLVIVNFQVSVKAAILSSFIDSRIGDHQRCAEKSGPAAVADGEVSAGRRSRPSQVLPTSVRRKQMRITGRALYHWLRERRANNKARTCTLAQGCQICSSYGCHGC